MFAQETQLGPGCNSQGITALITTFANWSELGKGFGGRVGVGMLGWSRYVCWCVWPYGSSDHF